jgi:DNA-binding MarR family transcriptional regulator
VERKCTTSEGTLLLDVWFIVNLTGNLLDDALRPVGLTGDEFGMYSLLYSFGPLTQTQISRWTGLAATTVSGIVRRIAGRRHVVDAPNPDDARSRMLELTKEGVRVTIAGAQVLATIAPRLADTLGTGESAVRAALDDLDQGLRRLIEAAPRPYAFGEQAVARGVSYDGAALTAAQSAEVRRYIEWVRVRDATA